MRQNNIHVFVLQISLIIKDFLFVQLDSSKLQLCLLTCVWVVDPSDRTFKIFLLVECDTYLRREAVGVQLYTQV